MGLQSQLNDVSSESIPLLLVAIIANCVSYLRSFLLGLLQSIGLSRFNNSDHHHHHHHHHHHVDEAFLGAVGSGLAGLIVLADQLNLNRVLSYKYGGESGGGGGGEATGPSSALTGRPDCVVCLSTFRDGDQVRKLTCRHVFHKDCFDGWLDHLNFNCPLCRSPLVSDERVPLASRRVGGDLLAWFSSR
jgi:E3 ubiquitin-protein ligase RHA2